jgi:hypothetical protein
MKQIKCKTCKDFEPSDSDKGFGNCALMGDSNEGMTNDTRAYGWDYEGYAAGVYVGENFGCIHWLKKW